MQKYITTAFIARLMIALVGISIAAPANAFSFYGPGSGINYTGFVYTPDGVGFSWPFAFVSQASFSYSSPSYHSYPLYQSVSPPTAPFAFVAPQKVYQAPVAPYTYNYTVTPQISPLNQRPIFFPLLPQTTRPGQAVQFTVSAYDSDSPYLRYNAVNMPAGAVFNENTRMFFWTPTALQIGKYVVNFRVSDPGAPYVEMSVVITVTDQYGFLPYTACDAHPGPYFLNFYPPRHIRKGELYVYQITGASGNNNPLSYRVVDGPTGLAVNEKTGYITWLVAFNQGEAEYPVRIAAYNGQCELSQHFTIAVRI